MYLYIFVQQLKVNLFYLSFINCQFLNHLFEDQIICLKIRHKIINSNLKMQLKSKITQKLQLRFLL